MLFACVVTLTVASTVCRAVPVASYRRNFTPLQFLQHAMMHENSWTLVLRERVRNLPPLPYEHRFRDAATLILGDQWPGDTGYRVRPILTNVLDLYSDVGSYVNYAAEVLHRSLKCFVIRHLVFQSHYIIRLFFKGLKPDTIMKELNSLKDNIVVSMDKLTVVPAELEAIFQLYWEVVWLMQYVMPRVRFISYSVDVQKKLEALHKQFLEYLTDNCTSFVLSRRFFAELHIPVTNLLILDNVLNVTVPEDVFLQLGRNHSMFFGNYLRNLAFETIPQSMWSQIFYYSEKLPTKDELDETNVKIAPPSPRKDKSTTTLTLTSPAEKTSEETTTTKPTETSSTETT